MYDETKWYLRGIIETSGLIEEEKLKTNELSIELKNLVKRISITP